MKIFTIILTLLILSGCETASKVEGISPPHSRLVYVKSYNYHGAKVVETTNWLLGSGRGLRGNSEYKLDMPTHKMGGYFQNAVSLGGAAVSKQIGGQVSKSQVASQVEDADETNFKDGLNDRSSSSVCAKTDKKEHFIGEWTLYFDTNSDEPNNFDELMHELKMINPTEVGISGHTDDRGNDVYNMDLSKRRALNAKLAIKNIWDTNNYSITWGGECPRAVLNVDSKSRALNRRVVVTAYNTPLVDAASIGSKEF